MATNQTTRAKLSILDLVPIKQGSNVREAIERSMKGVELADELGYERYWFAEHHNTVSLASSSTVLLMDQALSRSSRIRIGSGGIMLPNHSPLVVAEQFGTLANIHGARVDMGLGRAPGTDPMTAELLHRTSADPQTFANSIYQMQGWLSDAGQPSNVPINAAVSAGMNVPMWVLGSTVNGASIAAQLGLPFSVASHFAPDSLDAALTTYREYFTTESMTSQIDAPRAMVGVNVVVAETDDEARRLFTTHQQMFVGLRTGKRELIQPPRDLNEVADETTQLVTNAALRVSVVGSPETVERELTALQERTGADEFITTSYIYDDEKWFDSLRMLAEVWSD